VYKHLFFLETNGSRPSGKSLKELEILRKILSYLQYNKTGLTSFCFCGPYLSLSKHRNYVGGVEVWRHSFVILALDGGELSASRSSRFTSTQNTLLSHWTGDWLGPRDGLVVVERRQILAPPRIELLRNGYVQTLYKPANMAECHITEFAVGWEI